MDELSKNQDLILRRQVLNLSQVNSQHKEITLAEVKVAAGIIKASPTLPTEIA